MLTPRFISTADQMTIDSLSVYVCNDLIVKMRMIWITVTKKPRAKTAIRPACESRHVSEQGDILTKVQAKIWAYLLPFVEFQSE
jgi:hypothetical protein